MLNQLRLGDHICAPVTGAGARLAVATAFTAEGMRDRQKVLLLVDRPATLLPRLCQQVAGGNVALARGQLRIDTSRDLFRAGHGRGQPAIDRLTAEIDIAGREGYAGLRVLTDLTSAGPGDLDAGAVLDDEAAANAVWSTSQAMGVCHYRQSCFDAGTWRRLVAVHPSTVVPEAKTIVGWMR